MIAQSAVVPTREHRCSPTRHDEQARVEFDLWEGESPDPIAEPPPRSLRRASICRAAPAGDVLVLVEVTIDTDGVVRLGATEMVSGERAHARADLPRRAVARRGHAARACARSGIMQR